jgi:hypothetical protein
MIRWGREARFCFIAGERSFSAEQAFKKPMRKHSKLMLMETRGIQKWSEQGDLSRVMKQALRIAGGWTRHRNDPRCLFGCVWA